MVMAKSVGTMYKPRVHLMLQLGCFLKRNKDSTVGVYES